jgi:hypothetical protein
MAITEGSSGRRRRRRRRRRKTKCVREATTERPQLLAFY